MIKWQYKVVVLAEHTKAIDLCTMLDTFGNEGWEAVFAAPPSQSTNIYIILKRQRG